MQPSAAEVLSSPSYYCWCDWYKMGQSIKIQHYQ